MTSHQTLLEVTVVPGASRNQVTGLANGAWRLRVAAPAREGRANAQLIAFLAEVLQVPPRRVELRWGHTSRKKVLFIVGLGPEEVAARLARAASEG